MYYEASFRILSVSEHFWWRPAFLNQNHAYITGWPKGADCPCLPFFNFCYLSPGLWLLGIRTWTFTSKIIKSVWRDLVEMQLSQFGVYFMCLNPVDASCWYLLRLCIYISHLPASAFSFLKLMKSSWEEIVHNIFQTLKSREAVNLSKSVRTSKIKKIKGSNSWFLQ